MRSKEEGWTLVEMIFTFWIIGIFCSLAVPSFLHLGKEIRFQMFPSEFAETIHLSQLKAISREETVIIRWDQKKKQVFVQQGKQVRYSCEIPKSYRIKSNYPREQMVFQKTGQVRGGTIQIWEMGQFLGKMIIHVASGRVEITIHT